MSEKYTEEEYREAARIWRKENSTTEKIPFRARVIISNGKEVSLGMRFAAMRKNPEKLSKEDQEYWSNYGLFIEKKESYTEKEYREAAEIWRSENPNVDRIPQKTVVTISNGRDIPLGSRISHMRKNISILTEEEKLFWSKYGVLIDKMGKYTEEEYREAAEIWKKENPNKKIISRSVVIEISSGKKINLGYKLDNLRKNIDTLTEEEKLFWSKYGLLINKRKKHSEEEYREAAKIWRKNNPDLDKIPRREKVTISNGATISLGERVLTMRKNPEKLSKDEKEYWSNYGLFIQNKEHFSYTEKEYREAAEIWTKDNPDLDKIPRRKKITISSGKVIPLGERLYTMRRKPENLSYDQKEFWKDYGLFYKKERSNVDVKVTSSSLEKYTKLFDGDVDKAKRVLDCLSRLREKRKITKKEEWNVDNLLKEFNVNLETLIKYLERTRNKNNKLDSKALEYEGKTLKEYCILNGYNYDVIKRAIKLHDVCDNDSLEQLINRSITMYKRMGQKEPATWIYEKYGNLVKHILIYLKLDSFSILQDMTNYTITLEEAIRHDVFKHNRGTKENAWLEELYNHLIEEIDQDKDYKDIEHDLIDKFRAIVQEYKLTQEEIQILLNCFEKYVKTMRAFQIVDVGLETNQKRKIDKIKQYNLDEYDVEESFFVPLEFDKGVLLGRQSELYKRRQLLRQYIIDWDYYTDFEKDVIKKQNNFTDEELNYIENLREKIDETIKESVKKM